MAKKRYHFRGELNTVLDIAIFIIVVVFALSSLKHFLLIKVSTKVKVIIIKYETASIVAIA